MPPKKAISTRRPRTAADYRREALKRLKEQFEKENEGQEYDSSGQPTITPVLKSSEGGITRVLQALRAHDNEDARDFIELYDSLSRRDRQYLTLEEIAVAAGIGSLRLAEVATSAMILHGQMEAKFCLASSMKKVVKSVVKAATDEVPIVATMGDARVVVGHTNGDVRAMELFGKMTKLVPMPKGVNINFGASLTAEKDEDGPDEGEPAYIDAGTRLRQIHDAVEGQRRLPSPKAEPMEIGGHIDQTQSSVAEVLAEQGA